MHPRVSRNFLHSLFALFTLAALIACGGKKSGDAGNVDLNAGDIPKVTTAGGGGGDGAKDSEANNPNDLCNREGDAYARFGTFTNHSRDYVYKIAKDMGFDALYTAHPAHYAVADLNVMYNYYAQADQQVFGKINAEIEMKLAAFHTAIEKGEWKNAFRDHSGMLAMLQGRKSLFTFYSNIFGMTGYTWIEYKDFDGEIAAAYKPMRDKIANDTGLTAAQKAELDFFLVETARFSAVRVDSKDYVVHATYSAEKNLKIEWVAVATGYNYATYKQYTEVEIKAITERVGYYNTQITNLEAQYEATYKTKDTVTAAEFASATYTFQEQYRDLTAARDIVATFSPQYAIRLEPSRNYIQGVQPTDTIDFNTGDDTIQFNSK